jgi:hypothetical protein
MSVCRRVLRAKLAPLILVAFASPQTASAATTILPFELTGSLAVSEPHSCDGGTWDDATVVTLLSWTRCHEIKRHRDAAGTPITANTFVAAALRPLQVIVEADIRCSYAGGATVDAAPIATVRTQTNAEGRYWLKVPRVLCGLKDPPTDWWFARPPCSNITATTQRAPWARFARCGSARAARRCTRRRYRANPRPLSTTSEGTG